MTTTTLNSKVPTAILQTDSNVIPGKMFIEGPTNRNPYSNTAVDVKLRSLIKCRTIHSAVLSGHLGTVKSFIDHGTDVSSRDEDGWMPIHLAAGHGDLEITKLLLDKGADISSRTNKGWMPIHFAAGYGHLETVLFILRSSAG
jgi:ankyrin repeat protein